MQLAPSQPTYPFPIIPTSLTPNVKASQSGLTLCDPMDNTGPWTSPGQNAGVGSLPLLQGSSQLRSPALQVDSLPAEPPGKPRNHLCVHLPMNCSLVCEWLQLRFFLLRHVFYCMITSALIYPSCHWWTLRLGQLWTTLLWAFARLSAHMRSLL